MRKSLSVCASYFRQDQSSPTCKSLPTTLSTKLQGWLYMTDVPNHVGPNPACMLWHTSVTANVPALLRVRAHARILQYGNACTYACDNFDNSTSAISTYKQIERSAQFLRIVFMNLVMQSLKQSEKNILISKKYFFKIKIFFQCNNRVIKN